MKRTAGLAGVAAGFLSCGWPPCAGAQQSAEIQVSSVNFGDLEFDWGRDGLSCPSCNFGQGNSRFSWSDQSGNLWVGHVDPGTGLFAPAAGKNELVDTFAFNWNAYGNGPEWAFSTQNGAVISQLLYTRYVPGQSAQPQYAGAAFATPVEGGWSADFFPGAISDTLNTALPEGTQCPGDPVALAMFKTLQKPRQMLEEPLSREPGTVPTGMSISRYANGIAERWIPCRRQLVFEGAPAKGSAGAGYTQVFWYDIDTQVMAQMTTDPSPKSSAFMFQAPDFAHAYILVTVAGNLEIDVYQQTGALDSGAPTLTLVNQIRSPDPAAPYISSAEPFINCTPVCRTYMFMTLSPAVTPTVETPNGLAVAGLDPANPLFDILVPASSVPAKQRVDPEYFITPNGPYLYYGRVAARTKTSTYRKEGEFYIDMQLGAPSGPCVGSSAEGGLLPGC